MRNGLRCLCLLAFDPALESSFYVCFEWRALAPSGHVVLREIACGCGHTIHGCLGHRDQWLEAPSHAHAQSTFVSPLVDIAANNHVEPRRASFIRMLGETPPS